MTPVEDQKELFEAIYAGDHLKAWDIVKFAGYREMPSYQKRKLVFISAFKNFDPEINDNFIVYYMKKLHYANLEEWKRTSNPITNDKRALRDHIERQLWPTEDNEEPINQNSNILRKFRF